MTESSHNSHSSDSLSLAIRLREGTDSAWREMVMLYGPLLDHWCRSANVPANAVSDVAQEVFVSAFRSLDTFDASSPKATFRGWLWTITRNRIVDYHRKHVRAAEAVGGSTAYRMLYSLSDSMPVDDPTEADQHSALIHRAMNQIRMEFAARTWDAFWRVTVLGHPTDLVATETGVSASAVRQAKSRVLRRLRQQLGDR